jgi:hypothetical protein
LTKTPSKLELLIHESDIVKEANSSEEEDKPLPKQLLTPKPKQFDYFEEEKLTET